MPEFNFIVAFLAGLASFLSPCVLPLVPAFLGYLSGVSLKNAEGEGARLKIFLNTLFFVIGFSVVFAVVGVIVSSALTNASLDVRDWLARIGGIVIIAFGLFVLGLLPLDFLEKERKLSPIKTKYSYLTSFLFGASFAVGWSPCVGAILGSVLTLAATRPGEAFPLLLAYAIGLGVPFLVVGAFASKALGWFNSLSWLKWFNLVVGVILIILGVLVFTNTLSLVADLTLARFVTQ